MLSSFPVSYSEINKSVINSDFDFGGYRLFVANLSFSYTHSCPACILYTSFSQVILFENLLKFCGILFSGFCFIHWSNQCLVEKVIDCYQAFIQTICLKLGCLHCQKWLYTDELKKVQVGKDQEKEQSEKDSHSKNIGGKNLN